MAWRHGYFQFEVDELHPSDDFGVSPQDLLDNLDLNTQMLVLEATRLFDEHHRDSVVPEAPEDPSGPTKLDLDLERAGLGRAGQEPKLAAVESGNGRPGTAEVPVQEAMRCQVVSEDPEVLAALDQGLPAEMARVVSVPLREAGNRLPGEGTSPIVVLDLREGALGSDDVATLARTRPAAPLVALIGSAEHEGRLILPELWRS